MNRKLFTLLLSILAAGVFFAPTGRALADDESDEMQVEIKAPLDAVTCDVTPQTITVLGLTVDVTNAIFDNGSEGESGDDSSDTSSASIASGSDDQGGDDGEDDGGDGGGAPATCADLLVGRTVEAKLAGDVAPLVATEVGQEGGACREDEVEIKAPIQAVDPTLLTITLLGLPIDISSARMEGSDDEDQASLPIDPATLMVGQFVEVKLDPGALPALVATELEVKNFTNECDVDVEDAAGVEIDDVDANGLPVPTVTVSVVETVTTLGPALPGKSAKRSSRTLRFQAKSNGHVTLHGLPTGQARVSVTRSVGGAASSGRGSFAIAPNTAASTTIRLKGSKGPKGPKTK